MTFKEVIEFCIKHKYCITYGVVGLLSAILMLTIGFFRTLLILILSAIGITAGYFLDRYGLKTIREVIKFTFKRK